MYCCDWLVVFVGLLCIDSLFENFILCMDFMELIYIHTRFAAQSALNEIHKNNIISNQSLKNTSEHRLQSLQYLEPQSLWFPNIIKNSM